MKLISTTCAGLICGATLVVSGCGGGSSAPAADPVQDGASTIAPGPGVSPAATTPPYVINARGGRGGANAGRGGDGGIVHMQLASSGDLEILADATPVDAGFTPSQPEPNPGLNGQVFDTGTLPVILQTTTGDPAPGRLYMLPSNSRLYLSDGDGIAAEETEEVTGLTIAAGATLELPVNFAASSESRLDLRNDLNNLGTLRSAEIDDFRRAALALRVGSYMGDGGIDGSGKAGDASTAAQNGSRIGIEAVFSIYNRGPISSNGGSGPQEGGQGGEVVLNAGFNIENSGAINAAGGSSTSTPPNAEGGNGGRVTLATLGGSLFNSGDITASGGDGTVGGSGASLAMEVAFGSAGDLINSGNIDLSGGTGSSTSGGSGGSVSIVVLGGDIRSNADLILAGGDTLSNVADGGFGGGIVMQLIPGSFIRTQSGFTPAGGLSMSGQIDISGGDATATGTGNGGPAGVLEVLVDGRESPDPDQRIEFLGYTAIDVSGGDGNRGGNAPEVSLRALAVGLNTGPVGSGNIVNQADIIGRGGNVVAGAQQPGIGGAGAAINLVTDFEPVTNPDGETVNNSGTIDVASGDSRDSGGQIAICCNNNVLIWGHNGVDNSGGLDTSGSNDLGATPELGTGGPPGTIRLLTEVGALANSGALNANGGSGSFRAARGAFVDIRGRSISNSGPLASSGGDADPGVTDSTGGSGGDIWMVPVQGLAGFTQTGTVDVSGGTGATPGTSGSLVEGGLCRIGTCPR